jgi:flagellar protein FlbD
MIMVTRLDGASLALNADLIERVEAVPHTVVTLVDGSRYELADRVEVVVAKVRDFRADVLVAASELARQEHPVTTRRPGRLRALRDEPSATDGAKGDIAGPGRVAGRAAGRPRRPAAAE